MSGRDHSITCALCGIERGGLNADFCECDKDIDAWPAQSFREHLTALYARMRAIAEARDELADLAYNLPGHGLEPSDARRIAELAAVGVERP